MNLPSPWELEVFASLDRRQSFSKAAKFLGLTQGRVSQVVSALEKRYGYRLVRRSKKRKLGFLTVRGGKLHDYAKTVFRNHTRMLREMERAVEPEEYSVEGQS